MSILYIVATPIGNLQDISQRALEILRTVDLILCEDTRHTQKLLSHFGIKTKTLSYHQHSKIQKINRIIDLLKQGNDLALVSDAGTPGISDPGNKLINLAIEQFNNLTIVPIPGPSALTAAASVSGLPMDKFLFLGFPPAKRKRQKFFEEVANSKYPVILYESPHRILKTLTDLKEWKERNSFRQRKEFRSFHVVVCRELTKLHEITYRGTIEAVIKQVEKESKGSKPKGEFVVIVNV